MKLKDALLAICVVALLVAGVVLFLQANNQRSAALAQAAEAKHDADQAKADLEQLKSSAATQTSDNARLRSENQRLSQKIIQLSDENARLGRTNQWLVQQFGSLADAAQMQQQQLQQIQQENQQARQARIAQERDACIRNLQSIAAAKAAWALDNNKGPADVPTEADLVVYFPNTAFPVCPSGGTYLINAVSLPPTCSIPGHVLPAQ